jgi:type I restriction enzyme M protein
VGAEEVEDDGEPFEEKMERLVLDLKEQSQRSEILDQIIFENLERMGYDL